MTSVTRVADHLTSDEVKMRIQVTAGHLEVQKWLVIYNAIVDPRPLSEIAKHTALSESTVYRIISDYNAVGPEAIEAFHKGSGEGGYEHQPKSMSM